MTCKARRLDQPNVEQDKNRCEGKRVKMEMRADVETDTVGKDKKRSGQEASI